MCHHSDGFIQVLSCLLVLGLTFTVCPQSWGDETPTRTPSNQEGPGLLDASPQASSAGVEKNSSPKTSSGSSTQKGAAVGPDAKLSDNTTANTADKQDPAWCDPEILFESLKDLAATKSTAAWAELATRNIEILGTALTAERTDAAEIALNELDQVNRQVPKLVTTISDRIIARKLYKASFSLGRHIDVWVEVLQLIKSQSYDDDVTNADPQRLAACLTNVDTLMGNSSEGQSWRKYLLLDALKECSLQNKSPNDRQTRAIAQQSLTRLTQTPLSVSQRQFLTNGPFAALREELRCWAAEPVSIAKVLYDIEQYEQTGLPSNARRLALDCEHLNDSRIEARRRLAQSIDSHYRNANLRVAVSEELLNKLIPERNLEYAPVNEMVLGRQVRGDSLMASEISVRLLPDPHRVRLALQVTGEIAAQTTADAGPARFVNESQTFYVAQKPMEINMRGIALWPAEVDVQNQTRLRNVETGLDEIPLIGTLAKTVARSQMEMSSSAATQEVKQKIAAQARARVDAEAKQQLGDVVQRLNRELFDPLNSLALDPQMLDSETTDKRFMMRLRLAGDDQLGSHTPRPQAPGDSLASVQIHESMINNCIQRLELDGKTFTLGKLAEHIASRFNRTKICDIRPDHEDVTISFASKDAVRVHCYEGRLEITVSIAEIARDKDRFKNFQVKAFYRPEIHGRSAELKRDEVIQLIGKHLGMPAQLALRGVFSRAFSKNAPWEIVPERIRKEPKLSTAAVAKFDIEDGWIGVALGPTQDGVRTAARPK
jgi:hypothetical protein